MTTNSGSPEGGNPPAGGNPAAAVPWYGADAGDDIKGFVELKGFDTPVKAIESYRNLERLMGADKAGRGVIWPKDDADTDGWNGIYSRLGRPEKPDGYKLPVPEGQSDAFAKHMAPILHAAGLSQKQAETIATALNEYSTGQSKAAQEQIATKTAAEVEAIKGEWGAAYDQNVALGQRAAKALGLEATDLEMLEAGLGTAGLFKFMHKIGSMLGEDRFAEGGSAPTGQMTPAAARAALDAKMNDRPWLDRWVAGDAAAVAEKEALDRAILAGKAA